MTPVMIRRHRHTGVLMAILVDRPGAAGPHECEYRFLEDGELKVGAVERDRVTRVSSPVWEHDWDPVGIYLPKPGTPTAELCGFLARADIGFSLVTAFSPVHHRKRRERWEKAIAAQA